MKKSSQKFVSFLYIVIDLFKLFPFGSNKEKNNIAIIILKS
jgi:hypothetical protein